MLPAVWHRYIFLFGIIGLAAGMLFGTVPTSIPQIILGANWLLEKNYTEKWHQLRFNKIFWVLASLFFLHVIGMLYTDNVPKGIDDLRNKLPLLTLPLILFSTKPLSKKEYKLLFDFFLVSVLVSSICCFVVFLGYTKKVIVDERQASVFMSHIRFSLFIAFAIIVLVYSSAKQQKLLTKLLYWLVVLWLLFFMYKLEMATGFLCLVVVSGFLFIVYSFKTLSKPVSLAFVLLLLAGSAIVLKKAASDLHMFDKNPASIANMIRLKNMNGGYYLHDTVYNLAENGNLVTININQNELRREWSRYSRVELDSSDKKGNGLYYTLLRYMASKGLTKDSFGLTQLQPADIENIEKGITNYRYTKQSGLISRWRELVWEYTKYKRGENPSGHTLTMRLEFWKVASYIIHDHPLFGVGTGDIQDSFNKKYDEVNSKLDKMWRLRCHNQYLAICVAFGFVGLALFVFYLFYPAIVLRNKLHYLYWPFFIIILLSFITEDTLETQSGVSFFIFFHALFLWLASHKDRVDLNS
jgi:hypothetical protein